MQKRGTKYDSRGTRGRAGGREVELEDLENRAKGNEYILEPEALNERPEPRPYSSPLTADTGKYAAPHLSASRSVQFTASPLPPMSSTSFSVPSSSSNAVPPPQAATGGRYKLVSSPPTAPVSRSVGTALGPVASSHSNAGAVFGEPVKFGSWDKSRPALAEVRVKIV